MELGTDSIVGMAGRFGSSNSLPSTDCFGGKRMPAVGRGHPNAAHSDVRQFYARKLPFTDLLLDNLVGASQDTDRELDS